MITRKQSAKLGVAFCLGVAAITTVTLNMTHTRLAFANPIKGRVLRRKDDLKRAPNAKERAGLRQQNPDKSDKRELKIREFKDMPLKVYSIRNVDSQTWYKDLEIEVKNISDKPIYSIVVYFQFPDDKVEGKGVSGITMLFGLRKYIDVSLIANSLDPHLNPGDTFTFTIPERLGRGLQIQNERSPKAFRKFELHFGLVSFGDGTGFEAEQARDYRNKQSLSGIKKQS